ncbi:MAG TPA: glutamine-hydrolyzing GMP synthase [candidate division WOR-3 bacterium]|uniref:GMP synthase [glutamine-hydrolyzing] n=1 Tax=candidate division WOR-3 bacterium TaxID=2052148 RepID=A0A9C9EM24_UNCW3|nr:glutamine-hydrolyzing GMP synthase [candidate division WOR-3 bacterium]
MIAVIDFGSQYTQLIARRVRECRVYSEIFSCFIEIEKLLDRDVEGLILSGGPGSVYQGRAKLFRKFFELNVPVLGICYGMQLAAKLHGGVVKYTKKREYGHALLTAKKALLFSDQPKKFSVWMSHGDSVVKLPKGAKVIASTETNPIAGFRLNNIYGIQFHPEVHHTRYGIKIIDNFLTKICHAKKNWSMSRFIDQEVERIRDLVGKDKVLCAVSGGIDSTVAASLAAKAVGDNLIGIFVDNGLLRMNERQEVEKILRPRINLKVVDARKRFLLKLAKVRDPEKKRKIIGREFISLFEASAKKIKNVRFLVQGTLYPDVIESGKGIGPSAVIKSHHNVGGLPEKMKLEIIEPLRLLFKDEVRRIAKMLGLPSRFIERKPFPGPGLAVRIIGPVTRERLETLRQADSILLEEARSLRNFKKIWQIFAVLLPFGSVGVMGDRRTYDAVCAIRAVYSEDGMTADWVRLPYKFLARVSSRITNEVKGINRVVFDISSKPPSTIEWE